MKNESRNWFTHQSLCSEELMVCVINDERFVVSDLSLNFKD